MIVILKPLTHLHPRVLEETLHTLRALPRIEVKENVVTGPHETVHEIYLFGDTQSLSTERIEALPAVAKVIRITQQYRTLARSDSSDTEQGFSYRGVSFTQDNLNLFAGLCAVDKPESVKSVFQALSHFGLTTARMGAYKPRTSPYSFQGLGKACLEYVLGYAGEYGIKVIAMEVTHEKHVDEIHESLDKLGNPTGVMLQIGTRNAQNFELLRSVGTQTQFPILFKRGFGITLNESLNAAEYLAHAGNANIVFCLRGIKSSLCSPHRNAADFAFIPVIKRLTRMPVCIDPSHAVGSLDVAPDGMNDVFHATAQGVIAGANMVLVDFHPDPVHAMVDPKQAISIKNLGWYLDDIMIARDAYIKRKQLFESFQREMQPHDTAHAL